MQSIKGYSALLKILIKDKLRTGTFFGFKRSDSAKKKSKATKILTVIGIAFLIILLSSYLVMFVLGGSIASLEMGLQNEFLMLLIVMSQLVVFFFGISAVMGYLYFSKDNSLLSTLPIAHKSIFLAKFSMAYIAEFVISAYFLLISFATYGIAMLSNGVALGAEFIFVGLLCILAAPMMPLLIITFISIPVMQVVKVLKRNPLLQSIVVSAIFIGIMGLYFGALGSFMGGFSVSEEGSFTLPAGLVNGMKNLKKIFIYNAPAVDAMLGEKILAKTFLYLAINISGLAVAVLLSSVFYSRSIKTIIEGAGSAKEKIKITENNQRTFALSFLKKEIKTLINVPMLFMQSIMGIVMAPLMVLLLGSFNFGMGSDDGLVDKSILFSAGFTLYISSLLINATNVISMVGFSREGKHLLVLKSLPISAKQLVDGKLYLALLQNFIAVFLVTITFIIRNDFNILFGLGVFATLITVSMASSCLSLQNDLKNPNLNWKNITELTKNNKKSLKPTLTILLLGMLYMILGSIFAFVGGISLVASGLSFFGACLLINIILMLIFYRKLYDNPEALLNAIEG